MKEGYKGVLVALFIIPGGLFILIWDLINVLPLVGAPSLFSLVDPRIRGPGLIIFIAFIVIGSVLLVMGLIFVVLFIREQSDLLHKKRHNCAVCGAEIQLVTRFCNKCGAENVIRDEAFEKLEKLEGRIEKDKAKNIKQLSKRRLFASDKAALEREERMLFDEERDLRVKKTKLIIGSTREGKLEWIKTQYYDLNRTIQDIADDLGESMMTVRKFLNEIENQETTRYEK